MPATIGAVDQHDEADVRGTDGPLARPRWTPKGSERAGHGRGTSRRDGGREAGHAGAVEERLMAGNAGGQTSTVHGRHVSAV